MDARNSLSINIILLSVIGLWFSQKNPILKIIYPYYSAFLIGIFFTSFLMIQIVYMIKVWGSIEEMVGGLFLLITIMGEYVKMYPLLFTPERVNNLLNDLQKPSFLPKNDTQVKILKHGMRKVKITSVWFTSMCFCSASYWGFYPILDGSYKEYNLTMTTWIPFDYHKSIVYFFVYLYLYLAVLLSAFVNSVYDTFVSGFMIHVGIQLDLLSDSLSNIKVNHNSNTKSEMEEFMDTLVNCVKHHMDILRFAEEIENIFANGAMGEFCAAGLVIVVTLMRMTLVSPASLESMMLLSYFLCIMIELFVYCWFGNEITIKSLNVLEAAYNCDWHVCGYEKFRRTLLLLMVRLQKPIVVKAGNLIPLSIDTFMTIVKSSWSYFNLLRQVNDVDEMAE